MPDLINQPTAAPSRKMWSVMIAMALTSVVKVLLATHYPLLATPAVYDLLQAVLIFGAGYMVKERV